jgi:hypothetical protein
LYHKEEYKSYKADAEKFELGEAFESETNKFPVSKKAVAIHG